MTDSKFQFLPFTTPQNRAVSAFFEVNPAFMSLSHEALIAILEARQSEMRSRVNGDEVRRLLESGAGQFTVTRSAIAFTVDHGPYIGIEVRYLYVARGRRGRGAGRALVTRLRAKFAAGHMFLCCFSERQARAARLIGFEIVAEGDGWWHVTTRPAGLEPAPGDSDNRTCPAAPAPRDLAIASTDERVSQKIKTLCASALTAMVAVSCLDA